MSYRARIAVCYEIQIKHINAPCGQNLKFLDVKLAVHTLTARL
jgi:hypothetical protein